MQYSTLGRERKGSISTKNNSSVSNWFSSLKRSKKHGKNIKNDFSTSSSGTTSKSAWDLYVNNNVVRFIIIYLVYFYYKVLYRYFIVNIYLHSLTMSNVIIFLSQQN